MEPKLLKTADLHCLPGSNLRPLHTNPLGRSAHAVQFHPFATQTEHFDMHSSATATWQSEPKDLAGAPTDASRSHEQSQSETCAQPEAAPPLMHFPHCRLEITTPSNGLVLAGSRNATADTCNDMPTNACKLERAALPGTLVRSLLARFESQCHPQLSPQSQRPHDSTTATATTTTRTRTRRPARLQLQRHFDDDDEWVFSRCMLADFTGFREDDAEALSRQGSLCCWASVMLQQSPDTGAWNLGFVVHRIGVRDPASGWCQCF
ncbi:hypothetical protein BT67DRAFT_444171 [Trichocladium antarcticum]|uniref:Uncharacterized protein n=1 Tax=Trichocladium antarcticum TaxID=1450529 RepID=A0AAN6UFI6_9PEZI|nr:hypothetical protein BT67DRAFT_444171 [Trichocladium antarcticum]